MPQCQLMQLKNCLLILSGSGQIFLLSLNIIKSIRVPCNVMVTDQLTSPLLLCQLHCSLSNYPSIRYVCHMSLVTKIWTLIKTTHLIFTISFYMALTHFHYFTRKYIICNQTVKLKLYLSFFVHYAVIFGRATMLGYFIKSKGWLIIL